MSTFTFASFDVPLPSPFLEAVAASPDDVHVYVSDAVAGIVTVLDLRAAAVTTIAVPRAGALAITPDASRVYVSNGSDNTVTAIDAATNSVVATIPVGDTPARLAVSADGAFVYATLPASDNVAVIATATNTVVATVAVGNDPRPVVDVVRRGAGSRYECMNGGWQSFTNPSFKNEGECIAYYNSIH